MKFLKQYRGFNIDRVTQIFHQFHKSIDSYPQRKGLTAYGTPLVAPEKCTIGKVYGNEYTPNDTTPFKNGYGLWMKGESGYEHQYWHTLPIFPVKTGDVVERGTIVAYVGNSGNVLSGGVYVPVEERIFDNNRAGTHLHHTIVKLGVPYDPMTLLDLETEPSYTILDEIKATAIVLAKIAKLIS